MRNFIISIKFCHHILPNTSDHQGAGGRGKFKARERDSEKGKKIFRHRLYLMHLVPALTILYAQRGMIVQQTLCDLCLALACYRYIQWGYATPITIIW